MVDPVSIGIIGIQGAVSEHRFMLDRINDEQSKDDLFHIRVIRNPVELNEVNGVIIPGGESTTISRFLVRNGLSDVIRERVRNDSLAVLGTCAGCVILANSLVDNEKDVSLLQLMNMKVQRNAFGRQRESFEHCIDIPGIGSSFPAVFIRAPSIMEVFDDCTLLASIEDQGVMAKQRNLLALSFHPELTDDCRIHQYFISMVKKQICHR